MPHERTFDVEVAVETKAVTRLADQRLAVADEQDRLVLGEEVAQALGLARALGRLDQRDAVLDAREAQELVGGDGDVCLEQAGVHVAAEEVAKRTRISVPLKVASGLADGIIEAVKVAGIDGDHCVSDVGCNAADVKA
jgi:hypothetical protein